MLLAMIVLIIPAVFNSTVAGADGDEGVQRLSHVAAIVLWHFTDYSSTSNSDACGPVPTETHHHEPRR